MLQFVIWTIFLAVCDIDLNKYDTSRYMTLYIDLLTEGNKLSAYIELTKAYILHSGYFMYRFFIRSPLGILYAIAG